MITQPEFTAFFTRLSHIILLFCFYQNVLVVFHDVFYFFKITSYYFLNPKFCNLFSWFNKKNFVDVYDVS